MRENRVDLTDTLKMTMSKQEVLRQLRETTNLAMRIIPGPIILRLWTELDDELDED